MRWARLQADVDVDLRRGMWYKLLAEQGLEAVIEVNHRPRRVLRALLEVSARPPIKWSVVPTPEGATEAPAAVGGAYGVCPSCGERAAIGRRARRHVCPHCRGDFAVAWDEPYLR